MKKFIFPSLLTLLLLSSCGKGNNPITPSPIENDLIVNDVYYYYGIENNDKVNVSFTVPSEAEEVEFISPTPFLEISEDGELNLLRTPSIYNSRGYRESILCKAKSTSFEKEFMVYVLGEAKDFGNDVSWASSQLRKTGAGDGGTIFAGDSFFDTRYFWKNFYTNVVGDVHNAGISATTLEGWFNYKEELLIQNQPENIVFHLGTNDFWDLGRQYPVVINTFKKFMDDLHEELPDTHIYYFSIENRSYAMPGSNLTITIEQLRNFNSFAEEYCNENDFITFIDSFSHFTLGQGNINSELFKDGTHPIDEEYKFFVDALIEAGLDIEWGE